MDINEKKEMLMKDELSVYDLTQEEVKKMKKIIKKDIDKKRIELNEINNKIRDMKIKIDNWSN